MFIKGLDVLRWRSEVWDAGASENGFDDFLSEDEAASEKTDSRRLGSAGAKPPGSHIHTSTIIALAKCWNVRTDPGGVAPASRERSRRSHWHYDGAIELEYAHPLVDLRDVWRSHSSRFVPCRLADLGRRAGSNDAPFFKRAWGRFRKRKVKHAKPVACSIGPGTRLLRDTKLCIVWV